MGPWLAVGAGLVGACLGVPLARAAERVLRTRRRVSPLVPGAAVVATGALFAVVSTVFSWSGELLAYLVFAAVAVVLSIVDLAEKRLPNAIVHPSLVLFPVLLLVVAAASGAWASLLGAVLGAAALFVIYFVLALISPAGIGMGDVKLAALVGLMLGYLGWAPLLVGAIAGFLVGAVVSLIALATRKATLRSSLPFGPSMLAGAFLAILFT